MSTIDEPNGPEVWLTQRNIGITCRVVFEDETDSTPGVVSVSMLGAERESTAWLISHWLAGEDEARSPGRRPADH